MSRIRHTQIDLGHRNEVLLVGRLAATPEIKAMPSGDRLASFRLIVERPPEPEGTGRPNARPVDALECAAWRGDIRRVVSNWVPGDVVEVTGSLRRRFWRTPAGPANRSEVVVAKARRLARAQPASR